MSESKLARNIAVFIGSILIIGAGIRFLSRPNKSKNTTDNPNSNFEAEYREGEKINYIFETSDDSIKKMLPEYGIKMPSVPATLKLVLDEIVFSSDEIKQTRYFWSSEQQDATKDGWVPASMMKVFAAVGALQHLSEMGFDANAVITYKDINQSLPIKNMIDESLINSENMSYNRLIQLAGHERLHDTLLVDFPQTELNKPYIPSDWNKLTKGNNTLSAPEIIVQNDEASVVLPASKARRSRICSNAACTSLSELNNLMERIVLFKNLDLEDSLNSLLLDALASKKPRGQEFSNAVKSQITSFTPISYDKHGFNGEWYSQTVLLLDENKQKAFALSVVGAKGDRSILNSLGKSIGQLINKLYLE